MFRKSRNVIKNCIRYKHESVSYDRFVSNFPITQCSIISNGLTIATEERETNNVSMGLYIRSGARHESEENSGMTHFFEHIAFKGSKKRTKHALNLEISKTGAKFKCFTTREMTVYFVECLAQEVPRIAEILFDCIFNNSFINAEIEHQKKVVYQEMLKHDMSTVRVLYDYLHSTAFQGTSLAHNVMGPSKNLYTFNCMNLSSHVAKMFTPKRTVFAAAGGINHEVIKCLGEQYTSRLKCDEQHNFLGPKRYTGSDIIYRDDSIPVAHIAIAVEGPFFSNENKFTMDLAASVLGGWDASQPSGTTHGTHLAHVASAGALCESYKAFSFYYQDTGLFGVEFISPKLETDNMIMTIQDEWMRLCHTLTDGELVKAKNELKTKILSQLQTTTGACHDIGQYILQIGWRPSIREQMQAIDNITAANLKSVCEEYIYDKCPVIAAIGSTECLLPYSKNRAYMYWLRV